MGVDSKVFWSIIFFFKINIFLSYFVLKSKSLSQDFRGVSYNFSPSPSLQKLVDTVGNQTDDNQWTGGDCSCSTTITFEEGGKYELFFYADSSIGKVHSNRTRSGKFQMVHTTVGVYDYSKNEHIEFFWRPGPDSFFQTTNESIYYWSAQTISFSDDSPNEATVYVFLFRTLTKGFLEQDGMTIAEMKVTPDNIANPLSWNISYHQLPFEISSLQNLFNWGGMAVTRDLHDDNNNNMLYLWGQQSGKQKSYLSRWKVDDFRNYRFSKMEFYCRKLIFEGTWVELESKPFSEMKLKHIEGIPGNPESFVFYHPFLKKYLSILIPDFLGTEVYAYTSSSITGPFSKEMVWKIPSPWSTTKNLFAYALKSHQSFCGEEKNCVVFTYNTNCMGCDLQQLDDCFVNFTEFYIPQFMKVEISQ